jgi:uncharacterized protein (TIGR00369 family)
MFMSIEQHYRSLENMYSTAPNNKYYEPEMRVEQGKATVKVKCRDEFFHAAGALHGSVYFKLLDDSCFFAANSMEDMYFMLTSSFNVHLLKPVTEGLLKAEGRVVHRTKSIIIAESVLKDQNDIDVARGTGTFVRSKILLDEKMGYKY